MTMINNDSIQNSTTDYTDEHGQIQSGILIRAHPCNPWFNHFYNSIASTSPTNRSGSSLRNEATTWKTASLKPPTFRTSERSGACVVRVGLQVDAHQLRAGPVAAVQTRLVARRTSATRS